MTSGLVDLSTQPMIDPCRKRRDGFSCDWPLAHLRPGGVVVRWTEGGMLVAGHLPRPGLHVQVTRPGYCSRIGADETFSARLVTRSRGEFLVDACLRAPGLARSEATLRAMLSSARVAPPELSVDGTISTSGGSTGGHQPIPGADIRFVGAGRSITVRADFRGRFVLTAPPGTYRVAIIGHAPTANGRFLRALPQTVAMNSRLRPIRLIVSVK
jgi:hypothetical protein